MKETAETKIGYWYHCRSGVTSQVAEKKTGNSFHPFLDLGFLIIRVGAQAQVPKEVTTPCRRRFLTSGSILVLVRIVIRASRRTLEMTSDLDTDRQSANRTRTLCHWDRDKGERSTISKQDSSAASLGPRQRGEIGNQSAGFKRCIDGTKIKGE
ncbi:hypothetical protein PROFUN_16276, partial [Planoprotostelium fungivorum]